VATVEVWVVCSLDRIDRVDRTNNVLGRALLGHGSRVVLAINPDTRKGAVGGHEGRKSGEGEKSELSKHGRLVVKAKMRARQRREQVWGDRQDISCWVVSDVKEVVEEERRQEC
jgi:hypothetical protein